MCRGVSAGCADQNQINLIPHYVEDAIKRVLSLKRVISKCDWYLYMFVCGLPSGHCVRLPGRHGSHTHTNNFIFQIKFFGTNIVPLKGIYAMVFWVDAGGSDEWYILYICISLTLGWSRSGKQNRVARIILGATCKKSYGWCYILPSGDEV